MDTPIDIASQTQAGGPALHGEKSASDAMTSRSAGQAIAAPASHDAHDDVRLEDLPKVSTWMVILAGLVAVAAFAGLFALGWFPREKRLAGLQSEAQLAGDTRPLVEVAQAKRGVETQELVLPADARSWQETLIYPRANGYLKRLYVDIGDRVQAGQLLAEIDTPDLDADLNQAKASLAQAQADLLKTQNEFELAQTTFKRHQEAADTAGLARQLLDEKQSALKQAQSAMEAARASVKAAEANVERLTALQAFKLIHAPFAGTIASRNYDVGALMSSTANGQGRELFRLVDTSTLRVSVNVPQPYASAVKPGQEATLTVRNYPGREFVGTFARSAGAIDPDTRTLRCEIDFPNPDGVLFAGMYGQVKLKLSYPESPLVVPTSSLVFDSTGVKVWVVQEGKVMARPVSIGRDFGTEIEIASGLEDHDAVVSNPNDRLANGVQVQLAGSPTAPGSGKDQIAARP